MLLKHQAVGALLPAKSANACEGQLFSTIWAITPVAMAMSR